MLLRSAAPNVELPSCICTWKLTAPILAPPVMFSQSVLTGNVILFPTRVSKSLLKMTIQKEPAVSSRGCSEAPNRRTTLRWDLAPEEIRTMTGSLIDRVKKVYDGIGSLNVEDVSAENTLKALADAKLDYACKSGVDLLPPSSPKTRPTITQPLKALLVCPMSFYRILLSQKPVEAHQ